MKTTLGVIFGNRDFFPDHLVSEARKDILALFQEMNIEGVMLGENETKLGSVETYAHSKACADLFKANRDRIEGVLVVLPNFGDEKGVADTIKLSGLNVPILVQAYPDDLSAFNVERRRDAFCGKVSVCNNLRQYGYQFSLTSLHTSHPTSELFKKDLQKFLSVCRVVKGLRSARLGAIGARPGSFQTVRYSEKILQASGITVATVDLSEILGDSARLSDDAPKVKAKLEEINAYAKHDTVPSPAIVRMAKLGVVISDWMEANDLQATALQCWTSIQKNYGINACTLMSMMSNQLMPSACETDITGVVSMYALQLASDFPGALVDWNNNYADDPDRCVLFHCGNWAKSFVPDIEIKTAPILGNHPWRGKYLRSHGWTRRRRSHDLCPRQHRRYQRHHPRLHRRRRTDQRPAGYLWSSRRGLHSQPAKTACLPVQERLRASRRHDHGKCLKRPRRSLHQLYGLGELQAFVELWLDERVAHK